MSNEVHIHGKFPKDNAIQRKSYTFAVRIVRLYQHLAADRKEFMLSKQVLKSGTSIGANVEEAIGAISRREFSAKMSIAFKEARETSYWLRLLRDTDYLDGEGFDSVHGDCEEILRLLNAIVHTSQAA